ncbi:MAG: aldehyde dehydrogenase family protein [Verrucomicrobia bacterium]|nr:aldehyde dehydrogenase family protein [Verrucomicrobiota bacterium]
MTTLLPNTHFTYSMWIDGQAASAKNGQTFSRESPAHGVKVGEYPLAGADDVDAAVAAARRAFDIGSWPHLPGAERAKVLLRTAELIRASKDEFALIETLESGKPIKQARDEMEWSAALWDYAAALCRHLHGDSYNTLGAQVLGFTIREPIGVVGMITPWNFPLLIISQKLPFALAAGCTCVVKPSELTPGTTLRLGALLAEAGLPAGVVSIISGYGEPAGARLSEHPDIDMISFTGSTEIGKAVVGSSKSNLKKVELELGGKNPHIVFADADLEAALDAVVFGVCFNMGECCNSGSRLLVQRSIADDFINRVIETAKKVPVGDPLDEQTKIGAIIDGNQFEKILGYIESGNRNGARLRLGGKALNRENGLPDVASRSLNDGAKSGRFVEATVFDKVQPEMPIAKEEIFGPVLSILTFDTAEEAIRIANNTIYGLSAGVWTRDIDTAFTVSRGIRAGTIWINTFMDGYPELCFGGFNQSGLGRELGRFSIEEFTELKTVQVHLGPRTSWWAKETK